ncbi:hypothetical protein BH20ACI1_BH20ACI1_07660 [soil metagenome]
MSDLTIKFTGIGICYFDEEIKNWRVFMPKIENNHPFQIKIKQNEFEYLDVPAGSKISVINDSIPQTGENESVSISETLDIYSLHNEAIVLKNDKNKYAAIVTLFGFSLETDRSVESSLRFYNIYKKPLNGVPIPLTEEYSGRKNVVSRVISPKLGSTTEILINGESVHKFTHKLNTDFEVIFDNDCNQIHSDSNNPSDFQYYYNIIDWKNLNDKCKYELKPIPAKCKFVGCDLVKTESIIIPEEIL